MPVAVDTICHKHHLSPLNIKQLICCILLHSVFIHAIILPYSCQSGHSQFRTVCLHGCEIIIYICSVSSGNLRKNQLTFCICTTSGWAKHSSTCWVTFAVWRYLNNKGCVAVGEDPNASSKDVQDQGRATTHLNILDEWTLLQNMSNGSKKSPYFHRSDSVRKYDVPYVEFLYVFWRAAHKPQLPNHPAFEVPAKESGQTPAVCIVHIFGTRHGPISIPHHTTMGNLGSSSCPHPKDGLSASFGCTKMYITSSWIWWKHHGTGWYWYHGKTIHTESSYQSPATTSTFANPPYPEPSNGPLSRRRKEVHRSKLFLPITS